MKLEWKKQVAVLLLLVVAPACGTERSDPEVDAGVVEQLSDAGSALIADAGSAPQCVVGCAERTGGVGTARPCACTAGAYCLDYGSVDCSPAIGSPGVRCYCYTMGPDGQPKIKTAVNLEEPTICSSVSLVEKAWKMCGFGPVVSYTLPEKTDGRPDDP